MHTLKGHTTSVVKVAFSPDGKTLASAATTWGLYEEGTLIDGKKPGPGEMKLWDLVTGKERVTLKGHPGLALSMAFSPDGKTLATESSEETEEKGGLVRLWDVDTGKKKLELKQDNCVQSLAFSPDGKTLAVGTGGFFIEPPVPSSVVLWDVTTGKERARTLPAHTGWISWVGFAPDGKTLASVSCSADKEKPLPAQLKLWDAATAKERASIPLRMIGPIQFFSLAFTADGKTLTSAMWSCDEKKEVGLAVDHWELATGKARATFWAPLPRITYGERDVGKCAFPMAALSADGKTVAWRGAELEPMNNITTAHVWEVQSLPTSPPKLPE